ncbi:MAG: hypothetical protein EOP32_17555 [Rhodococcus sp. (in: high G+C Gram-positive bacteria)]|nr:MAG: hypothetical protein EOP32_17555 [Rhodococcus sp. (in: high G+C Gram-positive bacteria)]
MTTPQSLPCHRSTASGDGCAHVLTAIEVAERDTIIKALRECGGNRVHTAEKLGMARSSLYRKLKIYGATEI